MRADFHVIGLPIPQGSQVYSTTKDGRAFGRYANAQHLMAWREQVAQAAWRHTNGEQFTGPVHLKLLFYFDRPKSHYNSKELLKPTAPQCITKKPDIDKISRAVLDALESAVLMDGDETVVGLYASKHWADDHPQGCHIIIETIEGLTT